MTEPIESSKSLNTAKFRTTQMLGNASAKLQPIVALDQVVDSVHVRKSTYNEIGEEEQHSVTCVPLWSIALLLIGALGHTWFGLRWCPVLLSGI